MGQWLVYTLLITAWVISFDAQGQGVAGCSMLGRNSAKVHNYHDAQELNLLGLVNQAHFTEDVRSLRRGSSNSLVGGDLNYTLDVFPNHFQALDAVSRLSIKVNQQKPTGLRCTVDGYFERAIEFQPDDAMVRMTYGLHFYRQKKLDKAVEQFEQAEKLAPENINQTQVVGQVDRKSVV